MVEAGGAHRSAPLSILLPSAAVLATLRPFWDGQEVREKEGGPQRMGEGGAVCLAAPVPLQGTGAQRVQAQRRC